MITFLYSADLFSVLYGSLLCTLLITYLYSNNLVVLREQIVSICEVGVAWWGPMITKHESNMLERVLKTGLHVMINIKNFKMR